MPRYRRAAIYAGVAGLVAASVVAGTELLRGGHAAVSGYSAESGAPAGRAPDGTATGAPARTRICGQPVLRSRYRFAGKGRSLVTTFSSGQHGLPSYGSRRADYPKVKAGYVIAAGNNSGVDANILDHPGVLIYFAPGSHTNLPQVEPGGNSAFIGGYSAKSGEATIDNGGNPGNTFISNASNVTIEYLTITGFNGTPAADSFGGSIVDEYGGDHWTVDYDTVGPNGYTLGVPFTGYGIGVGSDSVYEYDCVIRNGEGGFNNGTNTVAVPGAAPWGGPAHYRIEHDEIASNAIATCQVAWGCHAGVWGDKAGAAAGLKVFWSLNGTIDYNYVHDNYGVALWPDTNNSGLDISYNYISNNFGPAIVYEASFNANITHNTIVGNGWNPKGRSEWAGWPNGYQTSNGGGIGFVDGAIYIDNSGGTTGVLSGSSRYLGRLDIAGNRLINNFGGVVAFQDRNRFCGEGAGGGQGTCTINGNYPHHNETGTPYYVQPTLYSARATVNRGSTALTAAGGFQPNYSSAPARPAAGWAVRAYNPDNGAIIPGVFPPGETIASCASSAACTLAKPALASSMVGGSLSGMPFEVETGPPGGCGMYDLMGSKAGQVTGSPPEPYFDNCNWWVRDVHVYGNSFAMTANPGTTWAAGRVTNCSATTGCGYMAIYANAGPCVSGCYWSPYAGFANARYILSGAASNIWRGNTYTWTGPGGWSFEAGITGHALTQADWRGPASRQDAGSVFHPSG